MLNRLTQIAAVTALALNLAACVPGGGFIPPERIDPPRTSAEMCRAACNRDYAVCTDSAGANLPTYGEDRQFMGRGAQCNDTLKNCLPRCAKLPNK